MSKFKFSTNLFLEKQELDRFQRFLRDDGFVQHLLQNTFSFGLIKDVDDTNFDNFKVEAGTNAKTIKIANESFALDNVGRLITKEAEDNIAPPDDGKFHWVKVKHNFIVLEEGTVDIDVAGVLTGTGTLFTEVLRGKPNFPSRINFPASSLNTADSYEVNEVIDDTSGKLSGVFQAESGIKYTVLGTFTPGFVPSALEENPFQYDGTILEFIEETVLNTAPAKTDGLEFYIARVKVVGASVTIEDKRLEFWKTKASFDLSFVDQVANPLIGVEDIKFADEFDTRERNQVSIAWGFRTTNWTLNSELRQITVADGVGGKFKTANDFTTGDFDGWRVYAKDGSYRIITSSIKSGTQFNLILEVLDEDDYTTLDELHIVPNVEQVQIKTAPDADVDISITSVTDNGGQAVFNVASHPYSDGDLIVHTGFSESTYNGTKTVANSTGTTYETGDSFVATDTGTARALPLKEIENLNEKFIFPVNQGIGKIHLLVPADPIYSYNIQYRYKTFGDYTEYAAFPDDATGFFDESSFDTEGQLNVNPIDRNQVPYTGSLTVGYIKLTINPNAFKKIIDKIDIGDILGVREIALTNATPTLDLTVGGDKQYQYFNGSLVTLTADMFVNLKTTKIDGSALTEGNFFILHFKQDVDFSTFELRIVENFINPTTFTLLKLFTSDEDTFLTDSLEGIYIKATWTGTKWIINSLNEVHLKEFVNTKLGDYTETAADIVSLTPSSDRNYTKMTYIFDITIVNTGAVPQGLKSEFRLFRGASLLKTFTFTIEDDGGSYPASFHFVDSYVAGELVKIEAEIIGSPSSSPTMDVQDIFLMTEAHD